MFTQTMITRNSSQQPAARIARLVPTNIGRFSSSVEMIGASMPFARNMEIYGEKNWPNIFTRSSAASSVPTRCLTMAAARSAHSTCRAISSASSLAASTPSPLKRLPNPKYK